MKSYCFGVSKPTLHKVYGKEHRETTIEELLARASVAGAGSASG